jgi:hypothetical protein
MDLYYTQMRVAEAAKLCGGAARTKLDGELRAIQGVQPDPPADAPRVTFTLTGTAHPTPNQATYTYRVTAHTSDVGTVVAVLSVTHEGGRWLVTSFSESEAPPTSRHIDVDRLVSDGPRWSARVPGPTKEEDAS